jgi:phosphate:Na+ symporter
VLAQLGIGALMTGLMQSSSAPMAITLTAAQGGLIDMQGAAAVVIGANIGTTATALLAAIGATPNARRAAAAHVLFNVLTATVALLLPWIIGFLGHVREALALPPDPAAKLALFHNAFNLLSVLLIWPLATRLTEWLQRCFRASEEDEAQPRCLDDNALAVPTLELDALEREVARSGQVAFRMIRSALAGEGVQSLARDQANFGGLDSAIERFVERLRRAAMSRESSAMLAELLRIHRYHESCAEQVELAAMLSLRQRVAADVGLARLGIATAASELLDRCGPTTLSTDFEELDIALLHAGTRYEGLKTALLKAGADGQLDLSDMERALRRFSALRRAAQQATKARGRLSST